MTVAISDPFRIVVNAPAPSVGGSLKLVNTWPVNLVTEGGITAAPLLGKQTPLAFVPPLHAVYGIGGDGIWPGGTNYTSGFQSAGIHFPRWHTQTHRMDGYYPYWGEVGHPIPAGMDLTPWDYDSTRNVLWLMGGYWWNASSPAYADSAYLGSRSINGVWKFDLNLLTPRWTQVSTVPPPGSDLEGSAARYVQPIDRFIGVKGSTLWWYKPADDSRGQIGIAGIVDNREIGRYNKLPYDPARGEIFIYAPIDGRIYGVKVTKFPTLSTRFIIQIASLNHPEIFSGANAGDFAGQVPIAFFPTPRKLVLFLPNWGTTAVGYDIQIVDVDTGRAAAGPSTKAFATQTYGEMIENEIYLTKGKGDYTFHEWRWV